MTGTLIGYDPGGQDNHGLALADVRDGHVVTVTTERLPHAGAVLKAILALDSPLGLGIDTLTCWSTSRVGYRPGDRWLRARDKYRRVKGSVVAPNALRGSMSTNGMAVLIAVRQKWHDIRVTETHPKVLYYAGCETVWHFTDKASDMTSRLNHWLDAKIEPKGEAMSEHEWDAAISVLPVIHGLDGSWKLDLHTLPTTSDERLVKPCGETHYFWPPDGWSG